MPDQTQEETVKDRVRRLRLEEHSIRQIQRELGVTKYTVEKAVRELEADRLRALSDAAAAKRRHGEQTATGPLPDGAVLWPDTHRTVRQTVQTVQLTRVESVYQSSFRGENLPGTGQKAVENNQKASKTAPFVGMYGFMADFRLFLYDMQRLLRQPRIWAHTLRVKHLKKMGELQARGQKHCLEQGLAYEELLLSGVLGACEAYVRGLLGTVTVNPALLGLDSAQVVQDEALEGRIKSALRADSFFAVSARRPDAVKTSFERDNLIARPDRQGIARQIQ